ncbi:MBL fold metallo-hydrolase [Dactylosporangium sp. AC04546]|uniref:MBL fold metallo-hydrolase n=1 Tax=Dactylosporangium sp. AC04546 TaxID=2862460 RepID=UPI001EDF3EF6|nr:MBL fold metallo-hydrolase [Dactylosporangium sp. AC04546]WVK85571.1 MBL fold metallo-hydrolase [Dactylosporangium sp. AC04546]
MSLSITKLSVGPMDNNAYLLRCTTTGEGILVDAANEPPRLLSLIGPDGISSVVTTHRHADHWQALTEVVSATGAASLAHPADAPEIPVVTDTLTEGDTLHLGELTLSVIHLVGHTPGSIALYYAGEGGHLFTGDSLFPGGPGRTTNPKDFNSLMDDLEEKVFGRLPDGTVIYPGHGKDSTLGTERPSIPEWRARGW